MEKFYGRGAVVLATVLLCCVRPARAGDELLMGDTIQLTRHLLGVRSRDATIDLGAGPGSADDPTIAGGSLRVLSIEGDVFDRTYPLPASGWRTLRRQGSVYGYSFRGSEAIRRVQVKQGTGLRVFGKGSGLGHTLGGDPAPVRVVLTLGPQQYCMSFGGAVDFKPGVRYLARAAAAPDICPLPYGNDAYWLCRPGMAHNQCFENSLESTVIEPDLSMVDEPE